jgi:hypothetical protein
LIVKKTHPQALPQVPAGRGRSLLRRVGTLGTQAHGRGGLGAAEAPLAQAGHLSPSQGDGTVSRLLRRPRRLPERHLPAAQATPRPLRGLPALACLLPAQALVRHPGQPAQRPRSPTSARLAPPAQDPPCVHTHRGLLAQPDRAALRRHETIHPGEHRRSRARSAPTQDLPLSPLPPQEARSLAPPLNRVRSIRPFKLEQHEGRITARGPTGGGAHRTRRRTGN